MPSEHEKALVIALVRDQIMTDPANMSYVAPYTKIRWSDSLESSVIEYVGGHHRRKALCKKALDSLACVCKQPTLSEPDRHDPPVGRKRKR